MQPSEMVRTIKVRNYQFLVITEIEPYSSHVPFYLSLLS